MTMKTILTITLLLAATLTRAALYTETLSGLSTSITDGSALPGSSSMTVSDTGGGTVTGLTVGLNFSGGYNGDLYVYLVGPNGTTTVTLLNRPGSAPFYAAGAGFGNGSANSLVLNSSSASIQTAAETAGAAMTGTYGASGSLVNFNGLTANGTWTLYFADLSTGGGAGPSVVNGWTLNLDVSPVPEPVNVALGMFGTLLALGGIARVVRRKKA
jgi:subtilisin-like proprotein convertase family protein